MVRIGPDLPCTPILLLIIILGTHALLGPRWVLGQAASAVRRRQRAAERMHQAGSTPLAWLPPRCSCYTSHTLTTTTP